MADGPLVARGSVDLDGELDLSYLRTGSGAPLLLLHGWPDFAALWKRNLPVLGESFDVIAPDLRGFGESRRHDRRPVRGTNVDVLVSDLARLLDALGIERCAFVSHDIGAYVVQSFARAFPDRVAALVFFNCPYPGIGSRFTEPAYLPEAFYQYFHQWPVAESVVGHDEETCRSYFGHFFSHWASDPHTFDDELDEIVANYRRPDVLTGGFEWYRGALEMRQRIASGSGAPPAPITHPTRVLWGSDDKSCPVRWSDKLAAYFTDLDFTEVSGAGHFVHYEQPALANREILAFLGPRAEAGAWR